MLGTPMKIVALCSRMARAVVSGSKRGRGTMVQPKRRELSMHAVAAKAWNIGSTTRRMSSPGFRPRAVTVLVALLTRLRCVSMAPFGRPVVPEV